MANGQKQTTDESQGAGKAGDQRPATMGTSIGRSEHHRRPSAVSYQQRSYRSLIDLTKSIKAGFSNHPRLI